MQTVLQDLRYGYRLMFKHIAFTMVGVLSLALGIGANTAIFSVVNSVFLRPLPVERPDQLVSLFPNKGGSTFLSFSYPNYVDLRDNNNTFTDVFAYQITPLALSNNGNTERLWGTIATGNYFSALNLQAAHGRLFTAEDDKTPGANPVAVVSYGLWKRRFGSDPNLVNSTIILNGNRFTIIGIAPEGFVGTEPIIRAEIWVPIMMQAQVVPGSDWLNRRGLGWLRVIGRMKPGVDIRQAQTAMNTFAANLEQAYPDVNKDKGISVFAAGRLHPDFQGMTARFAGVLMAVVGLVLLIACINLAGLLLARASARRREIGIRLALGASRGRLIQQLLVESVLLSLVGGLAGFLLSIWVSNLIMAIKLPTPFPIALDLSPDSRVFVFALALSLVTGILFGLAPALQASKADIVVVLKDQIGTLAQGFRRSRLRSVFVVTQVALSIVLLIAAGLFIRSLQKTLQIDPGFRTEDVLLMSMNLSLNGYKPSSGSQFYQQLTDRLETLPTVTSVTWSQIVPLGLADQDASVNIEGYTPPGSTSSVNVDYNIVGLKYFETLGIPLVAGRDFNIQDKPDTPAILIVNETFARRYWPGQDPINRRVSFRGPQGPFLTVVGVAKDSKYRTIGESPRPYIYLPLTQNYNGSMTLQVRTAGDPTQMVAAVTREIQRLDPNLPAYDIKTMTEHMGVSLLPAKLGATLLGVFGLLALTLTAIGIYGLTAFSVVQRRREIGVRMALGAQTMDVLRLVMRQGLTLTLIGLIIGLIGAFLLGGVLSRFLYGISMVDPLTYFGIPLALMAVAVLACYFPARRATKVDPMVCLRQE